MDRMASEVGCRMNEVDRLRAEASSLLNAARSDAATVAQNELHSLNCRIDEMHKQTIDIRDDIQACTQSPLLLFFPSKIYRQYILCSPCKWF